MMLSSITFGGFIYLLTQFLGHSYSPKSVHRSGSICNEVMMARVEKILLILNYFIFLPLALLFFFKAITLFITNPGILGEDYRNLVFSSDIIFPQTPIFRIFSNLFWHPIRIISLFVGGAIFIVFKKRNLFFIASLLFLLEAITSAGRFQFYIIICIYMSVLVCRNDARITLLFRDRAFRLSLIPMAFLLGLVLVTTFSRVSEDYGIVDIFNDYVIGYHTLGFTLFDIHLNDPGLMLGEINTYGRASLGTIEWAAGIFFRRFDPNISNISMEAAVDIGRFITTGYDDLGHPISFNAFGTILYTIYMDGGIPLTLFLSSLYGFYLLKLTNQSLEKKSVYSISLLFFLIYVGIFGIFQPLMLLSSFWPSLIYLNLLLRKQIVFFKR